MSMPVPNTGTMIVLLLLLIAFSTPGSNLARSRKFRPLSGRFRIWSLVTTPPTWCCSYFICGVASATFTTSETLPSSSSRLTVVVVPTSTMARRDMERNPRASIFTSYAPAGNVGTVYEPSSEMLSVRSNPVSRLVIVMSAFPTAAPLWSVTVPEIPPPGAWARQSPAMKTTRIALHSMGAFCSIPTGRRNAVGVSRV